MSFFNYDISRYTATGEVNTRQNLKSQPMSHVKRVLTVYSWLKTRHLLVCHEKVPESRSFLAMNDVIVYDNKCVCQLLDFVRHLTIFLLQSATSVITWCDNIITKCDTWYKVQQNGSSYRGKNDRKCMKEIQGKSTFFRVSARFELSEVNCTYFSASTTSPIILFGIPPCRETKLWSWRPSMSNAFIRSSILFKTICSRRCTSFL